MTPASLIFGVITLAVLVALHWLAYRVGETRRRANRRARRQQDLRTSSGSGISNEPITPR